MSSLTPAQCSYIAANVDFWEVFKPNKEGYSTAMTRRALWEKKGNSVIPYEDAGVSVGFYVMMKDGIRGYGEKAERQY